MFPFRNNRDENQEEIETDRYVCLASLMFPWTDHKRAFEELAETKTPVDLHFYCIATMENIQNASNASYGAMKVYLMNLRGLRMTSTGPRMFWGNPKIRYMRALNN